MAEHEPWFAALAEKAQNDHGADYRVEIWQSELRRLCEAAAEREQFIRGLNVASEVYRLDREESK